MSFNQYLKSGNQFVPVGFTILFFSAFYTLFFSHVIFSDRLLAPSDGLIYYVPAFYSPRVLWTNLILSGFPVAADPQVETWYPLSLLFSLIPNSWNVFFYLCLYLSELFCLWLCLYPDGFNVSCSCQWSCLWNEWLHDVTFDAHGNDS